MKIRQFVTFFMPLVFLFFLTLVLIFLLCNASNCCARYVASLGKPSFKVAINTTPQFGKTHFIVGLPNSELPQELPQNKVPPKLSSATAEDIKDQVLFGPDDNLRKKLLELIAQEQKKISVAVFMLTDKKIAEALVQAKRRGTTIEVVTDPNCIRSEYNKIKWLLSEGIPVFVYDPRKKKKGSLHNIMHNKFVIFEQHKKTGTVWTGSLNFTKSASQNNQETAVIL